MKVLILAAGYGTRLAKDLEETGRHPELRGVPKPLLPVAGKPLVSHWMKTIRACPETRDCDVYVVVNAANCAQFEEWAMSWSKVELVCDGTSHNDSRLGAVKCIELAVSHFNIHDHLIVVGGDLLFFEDFSLSEVVRSFHSSSCIQDGGGLVTYYLCEAHETRKFGILEVDDRSRVVSFLEKPLPQNTSSRRACPCFYILSEGSLPLLHQFLQEYKDEPLAKRDAPGNFIRYLCSKRPVFAVQVSGRFDIGNLQSYEQCVEWFRKEPQT